MGHLLFAQPITDNKTNNCTDYSSKRQMSVWQRSSSNAAKNEKRSKENEIQFLTNAVHTPRDAARFGHAGWQRFSGAPLPRAIASRLRSRLRPANAFAGRPARRYARQIQRRSHGNV